LEHWHCWNCWSAGFSRELLYNAACFFLREYPGFVCRLSYEHDGPSMTAPWREQHIELPPGGACAVPCAELARRTSASVVASRCGSCAPAPCPLPPSSWQPAPATDTSSCSPCSEENVTLVASPYDTPHGCELVLKKKAGRCWTTPSILPSPGDASSSCQPHRTYTYTKLQRRKKVAKR